MAALNVQEVLAPLAAGNSANDHEGLRARGDACRQFRIR
jgi:hypothetical protein